MSDTIDDQVRPRFRARVLTDLPVLRQQIDQQEPEGEAEILVAVFGVPDTEVAVGNTERQIIDRGAFSAWLATNPFPAKLYRDHGAAIPTGIYKSAELIGSVRTGRETDEGLVISSAYNLRKTVGRDMFSDLLHEPKLVEFSFASDARRERTETREGDDFEHVVEIWPAEFSQVGEAAQKGARLIVARTAIASHSTPTSDAPWSGPRNEAAYPNEAAVLRSVHAWRDPQGDADAKATYKFNHHFASGRAASTRACSAIIAILNGGRGGANIPDSERSGVHAHAARHLRDADMDVPPLRSAAWTPEELGAYVESSEFMEAFGQMLVDDPKRAGDVKRAAEAALAGRPENEEGAYYRQLFDLGRE